MRESQATTIRRADYAPPAFWIRDVELTLDLDASRTLVMSRMQVERNTQAATPDQPLQLQGAGLTLLRVLANGEPVSFRHENGILTVNDPPQGMFTLEIRNTCAPDKNTQLNGLYTSGNGLFTQCEAEGFRRITYFLDRPDVMATYKVTLRANKLQYPVLLSNGNLLEQGDLAEGRHFAVWQDPFPKPCYLFAVVAAGLVAREQTIVSRAGKKHVLQIWVRPGDLDKTEHAMQSLIASIVWDEARFGLALDLERFMVVAVGDFNMGAMENKGLNIFNTKYVLAHPAMATDVDYFNIESTVAHEYFHNWTGNRVTCRDWFQLSLKEGLTVFRDQEFSMDMAGSASARAVRRIEAVRDLRETQFAEDAGPMSHPVRPDQYVEINNFYTTTIYDKGAEVVRMMQTLVGRAGFAKGMALYFERHDGQAVTCDDFAQAIADANPTSTLATSLEPFKRWYAQAGTPTLQARGRYDAPTRTYTLALNQSCAPSKDLLKKAPFVIPVQMGLLGRDGQALPLQLEGEAAPVGTERLLILETARSFFTFVNVDVEPVPSLLRGFSAPVKCVDGLGDADLLILLKHDPDPFSRWDASQRLALSRLLEACRNGGRFVLDVAYTEALRQVLRDEQLAPAFKTLLLVPPSETYLAEQLDPVEPQHIHAARESMLMQLAHALQEDWAWAWATHQVAGGYVPEPGAAGQRDLANFSLALLCREAADRSDPVWPGRAYQRFKEAGNMTDQRGALVALQHAGSDLARLALEQFHARFQADPLALDKWFALQALAPEHGDAVFEQTKALTQHADFSLTNPNRVHSLIGAFCYRNPAAFHRPDGAGYIFWAEHVLELDALNPQLAARLARAMDHWRRLAEPYRGAALETIKHVASHEHLSGDVREVIQSALEEPTAA
jgi:aminopeptidase N